MKTGWKVLLIYTFFVILWGAFVRASGSGDGCGTHWPSCEGSFLLDNPSSAKFIEYTHRASSGVYGIFVFILTLWTLFSKKVSSSAKLFSFLVFIFTLLEALIGAKLVLSGLVGKNTSLARAVVMMIHLSNTLILVACNFSVVYFLSPYTKFKNLTKIKPHLLKWIPVLILFFLTGASGALAALGDTLYPSESLIKGFTMDIDPSSPLLVKIRSFHPFLAFTLTFIILWLVNPKNSKGLTLIAVSLIALILGLINLVLLAPLPLQLAHLCLALIFWCVTLAYFFDLVSETT